MCWCSRTGRLGQNAAENRRFPAGSRVHPLPGVSGTQVYLGPGYACISGIHGGPSYTLGPGMPGTQVYHGQVRTCVSGLPGGPRYILGSGISASRACPAMGPFLSAMLTHYSSFFQVCLQRSSQFGHPPPPAGGRRGGPTRLSSRESPLVWTALGPVPGDRSSSTVEALLCAFGQWLIAWRDRDHQ